MKQIGFALHKYHDKNKTFPPAFSQDSDGKPLLSWRVAILPYLDDKDAAALYKEFDLTKPWDDPKNQDLIAKMPRVFVIPEIDAGEGKTHYRTLVGPGAPSSNRQRTPRGNGSA